MLDKYIFLAFDIVFGITPMLFVLTRHKKAVWKYRKMIVRTMLFSIPISIILDVFGISWGAWQYSYTKSLNIIIFGSLIEVIIWGMLFVFAIGLIVAVFAEKEEKKKSFKPFF